MEEHELKEKYPLEYLERKLRHFSDVFYIGYNKETDEFRKEYALGRAEAYDDMLNMIADLRKNK